MDKGTWYALGAYTAWGLLPVYWKWLHQVPALQVLGHRIVWSFLWLCVVVWLWQRWRVLGAALLNRRALFSSLVAAVLLGVNWLVYIWAVNANFVVETSLGYFINPLLNVAMGVVFFRERLRSWQWVAVGLAGAGVLYLTFVYGALPWIALSLALTFACYGLVKKTAPLGALDGLTVETGILFLPALVYLLWSQAAGRGALLHTSLASHLLLLGTGLVTTVPLLMFASAAQRIPLSLVGIFQYIAPTLQFLLGVLVYGEPFSHRRLVGFALVWVALLIFALESVIAYRARSAAREAV